MKRILPAALIAIAGSAVSSDSGSRYLDAKHILVETDQGVMWYCCGGGDFVRLQKLLAEGFSGPAQSSPQDDGEVLFSMRVVGESFDERIQVTAKSMSKPDAAVPLDQIASAQMQEMVRSRLDHGGQTIPGITRADELPYDAVMNTRN